MSIQENIRVVLWGLGAMASGMAKILLEKQGVEIVGAIAKRREKVGKDLGEVLGIGRSLGVVINDDAKYVLDHAHGDIVLHTTNSFIKVIFRELELAIKSGYNIITLAEEMIFPWVQEPKLSDKLSRMARKNKVTVLGTGINPGFILDTLIILLTSICSDVKSIRATRINDISCFGPTVMKTQGVGISVEEFEKGVREGPIVGHIGFPESMHMIADSLGWKLDEVIQIREPIISNVPRETAHAKVEAGMVAGCRHIAYGIKDRQNIIILEHPQQIHPEAEGVETGDYIEIEGTPTIRLVIKPEVPGGIGTMAIAVNMIPRVIQAPPGLVTMKDLPISSAFLGDLRELLN